MKIRKNYSDWLAGWSVFPIIFKFLWAIIHRVNSRNKRGKNWQFLYKKTMEKQKIPGHLVSHVGMTWNFFSSLSFRLARWKMVLSKVVRVFFFSLARSKIRYLIRINFQAYLFSRTLTARNLKILARIYFCAPWILIIFVRINFRPHPS